MKVSNCLYHPPAFYTLGADANPFNLSIYFSPDLFQVGQPTTFGRIVSVTHVVTDHRSFSTNITSFCHLNLRTVFSESEIPKNKAHNYKKNNLKMQVV